MNAGFEPLVWLEDLDESKRRMPIVFYYSENDEFYSKDFCLSQLQKLQKQEFNVWHKEGLNLEHAFSFKSFEILKSEDVLHKAIINGHWIEYRPESFIRYVLHPLREHLNTLVFLHGLGSYVHGGMSRYTDVLPIVSPNTKILFLQADEKFLTKN